MKLSDQMSRLFVKPLIFAVSFQLVFSNLPVQAASEPKHCVNTIKIKYRETYFSDGWLQAAKQHAALKWQKTVKKRFGSVYSNWALARNQKSQCNRIGFGSDLKGNIGTFVLCSYSAEPCVNLLDIKAKKSKQDDSNRHQ